MFEIRVERSRGRLAVSLLSAALVVAILLVLHWWELIVGGIRSFDLPSVGVGAVIALTAAIGVVLPAQVGLRVWRDVDLRREAHLGVWVCLVVPLVAFGAAIIAAAAVVQSLAASGSGRGLGFVIGPVVVLAVMLVRVRRGAPPPADPDRRFKNLMHASGLT